MWNLVFGPTYLSLRPALCAALLLLASGWGGGVQAEGISTPLRWRAAPVSQLVADSISASFHFILILFSFFCPRVLSSWVGFVMVPMVSTNRKCPQLEILHRNPACFPLSFDVSLRGLASRLSVYSNKLTLVLMKSQL